MIELLVETNRRLSNRIMETDQARVKRERYMNDRGNLEVTYIIHSVRREAIKYKVLKIYTSRIKIGESNIETNVILASQKRYNATLRWKTSKTGIYST